jgi:hypothetical protein
MAERHRDVFLSYSSPARVEVEQLTVRLEGEAGLKVFLDKWRLVAGQDFIPELERAISASVNCDVFLGIGNVRPWQPQENAASA